MQYGRGLTYNYLCLPGNTFAVACGNVIFGSGPVDTNGNGATMRLPCKALPWNCPGRQPAPNAPCIAPGVWFVLGSIVSTPTTPVIIGGNTTVSGNLTVLTGSTITIRIGAVVNVQGCVTIDGNLVVDASGRTIANGTEIDLINFNNSACAAPGQLGNFSVTGTTAEPCRMITARDRLNSRGLSVVFQISDVPGCGSTTTPAGATESNTAAIIGGAIGGALLLVIIIAFILLFVFRRRIIPAYRMDARMRKVRPPSRQ